MLVLTREFKKRLAATSTVAGAGAGADGVLVGVKVELFTTDIALDEDTLYGDLLIPTYPGYAPVTVTWAGIYERADGAFLVTGQLIPWKMTDATIPTTVMGYALVDGTSVLLATERFDQQEDLVSADDAIVFAPQVAFGADGDWGTAVRAA